MFEKQVKSLFKEKFDRYKDEKLVIYGTDDMTKAIIEEFPDYNIIGLLHENKTTGQRFGKPILSYDAVKEMQPYMIIIVTVSTNLYPIYRRLRSFCMENEIALYYVDGLKLDTSDACEAWLSDPYWQKNTDELKRLIRQYDNISFDIFDTLIMRKTMEPKDVFRIWEDRATKLGIKADGLAEKRMEAERDILAMSPTIYEIYSQLQRKTGMADEVRDRLLALEISIEKSVLVKRDVMADILKYAVAVGKHVSLISDMYLDKEILKNILADLGIVEFDSLFVSCEYHTSKCNGLYDIYRNSVPAGRCLHIGDNVYADGEFAEQYGIDAYLIRSGREIWEKSPCYKLSCYIKTINDRVITGMFIAELFNNPFCCSGEDGRLEVEDVEKLAYLFCGGVISGFVIWMADILRDHAYDELLLCARDGYLINRIYKYLLTKTDRYKENPEGVYILCSRQACAMAAMRDEADIIRHAGFPYNGTPEEMLRVRFGLSEEETETWEAGMNLTEYVLLHKDKILKSGERQKKYYIRYLQKHGICAGKKYLMFDLFTSGTCLNLLSDIMDTRLDGVFLGIYGVSKNPEMTFFAQIDERNKCNYNIGSHIFNYYWFFETFMTSSEPSLERFDEESNPVFGPEKRDADYFQYISEMQRGIWRHATDFISSMWVEDAPISRELLDEMFGIIHEPYINITCPQIRNLYLYEDLGKGQLQVYV